MQRCDERGDKTDLQRSDEDKKDCTPETWRRKRIKVIYKKGDVEEAINYLPYLYITSSVHIIFNTSVQQAVLQA